jgi:hypothetical protein
VSNGGRTDPARMQALSNLSALVARDVVQVDWWDLRSEVGQNRSCSGEITLRRLLAVLRQNHELGRFVQVRHSAVRSADAEEEDSWHMKLLVTSGCLCEDLEMIAAAAVEAGGDGVVVAGRGSAVAAADFEVSSSRDTAEPIPACDLEDCPHQFPQRSKAPWAEESLPAKTPSAYPALLVADPSVDPPAGSSPLPASDGLLRPLREASFALIHPDQPIATAVRASDQAVPVLPNVLSLAAED